MDYMTSELLISLIADWAVIPVVIIGAVVLLVKVPRGQRFAAYSRVLMAGLTAYLLAKLAGAVYQPSGERPFEIMGVEAGASFLDNPGFPSDHMLLVSAIVFAVWFETRQKSITILLAVLAILVGVGRVLALVHTPVDVIGGMLIALIGAFWYLTKPVSKKRRSSDGKSSPK